MTDEKKGEFLGLESIANNDWAAWNDLMPPGPISLHVAGDIEVANPGIEAILVEAIPQGTNPDILLLDLYLIQRPGVWTQNLVTRTVRFAKETDGNHTSVSIFHNGNSVADVPVINVR